jgi:hypothetical protein
MTRIIQATWNFVTNGRDPSGSHRRKQRFTPREAVKFNDGDNRAVAMDYPLARHVIGGFVFIVLGTPGIRLVGCRLRFGRQSPARERRPCWSSALLSNIMNHARAEGNCKEVTNRGEEACECVRA